MDIGNAYNANETWERIRNAYETWDKKRFAPMHS